MVTIVEFDAQFWVQMAVYLASFAYVWGAVNIRIKTLEKKMDKHNDVIERTFKLEERAKSNTHRIDTLEDEVKEMR